MSDPDITQPTPRPQASPPTGATPTGYQRTTGGQGVKWLPPSPERLAELLPQYQVEALIGRGGMGAVYKGMQKTLERPVAIKILPPEIDDEDASYTERFKNEAKIMARLEHPAIVPVYDFGETSDGLLYFVMGFINGTDIHQMIQSQGRLPPEHALAITAHVCDALQYAHSHGVVHRDIKPSNILINMQGQVKVADFGLAKAHDTSQSSGLTKTGLAMGTPDYVAPETLSIGMVPDGRADLYAVGVMLYQMLTGQVPRGAFDLPSKLTGCDPRFDSIVIKAMKYDREDRYPTATDLRRDLDIILTAPMVQSGGQSSAAIPKQSLPQKPTGKPVQPRSDAGTPARQESPPAGKSARTTPEPPAKGKTALIIGLGAAAAIGIGAFVMLGGKKEAKQSAPLAPSSGTSIATVPKPAPAPLKPATASPSAPVSQSPPLPASKSSDKFPPGQWVRVLTKFEDLPEELRKPDSGVKLEDGWFVFEKTGVWSLEPGQLGTNHAIRARIRQGKGVTNLQVRLGEPSLKHCYQMQEKGQKPMRGVQLMPLDSNVEPVIEGNWPRPAAISVHELGVVNNRLVARVDGSVLSSLHANQRLGTGVGLYCDKESFSDLEVINLDGLSEAEALKILGVDEKGNDLRQKPAPVASATPASSSPPPVAAKSPTAPVSSSQSPHLAKSSDPNLQMPLPQTWNDTTSYVRSEAQKTNDFEVVGTVVRAKKPGVRLSAGTVRLKDVALKVRYRALGTRQVPSLEVRNVDQPHQFFFSQVNPSAAQPFTLSYFKAGEAVVMHPEVPPASLDLTGEHEIVLAAEGDLLTCWLDSKFLTAAHMPWTEAGLMRIRLEEGTEILSVHYGELGERSLAFVQEQQKADMAKKADAMAAIPELKTLHEQFTKLTAERVTAPFETDVAKLNNGYLGGIDRKIAEERGKGNLDGVLALEAEKTLVAGKQPVPVEDDNKTTATLKDLRKIYREAHAKLEANRAANLKLLTDPLAIRLKQLESTLTQANRIDHAKTVREYRESLGKEGSAGTPARNAMNSGAAATTNEADKSVRAPLKKLPPGDDRKAAEWALDMGGVVDVLEGKVKRRIQSKADLPKRSFDLVYISIQADRPTKPVVEFTNLSALAGLRQLSFLEINGYPVQDDDTDYLATLPELKELNIIRSPAFSGRKLALLKDAEKLERLNVGGCLALAAEGIAQISQLSSLTSVMFNDCKFADADLPPLRQLKKLTSIGFSNTPVTLAGWKELKGLPLTKAVFVSPPGQAAEWCRDIATLFPDINSFDVSRREPFPVEDVSAAKAFTGLEEFILASTYTENAAIAELATFPKLTKLSLRGGGAGPAAKVTDEGIAHLAKLRTLQILRLENLSEITEQGVIGLKQLKRLELPSSTCPKFNEAAFKKARPDVTLAK